ncbi:Wd repeat-containing protein 47 [Temnothorax longispinosus]|uniref:Wd repeat-containing protein 47 n=1 Tax=Temnothorax longispinosus TaxID=300112 RepID=A0A4S2KY41_9HYME|nr:Wd repeat-containing protein 47 [Temnothorax longispinosus]
MRMRVSSAMILFGYYVHLTATFPYSSLQPDAELHPQFATQEPRPELETSNGSSNGGGRPRFVPVTALEDVQAIRCAEFHPHGKLYAVGSNSKTLRICAYPKLHDVRIAGGSRFAPDVREIVKLRLRVNRSAEK